MKFCPQCGTAFEPEARFCHECGFDNMSVEQFKSAITTLQEETVTEKTIEYTRRKLDSISKPAIKLCCPQCGKELETVDRFCPECGFDTSVSKEPETEIPQVISQPEADEIISIVTPVEQPATLAENTHFCPQCGSVIEQDECFCHECGFDTKTDKTESEIKPEPEQITTVSAKQLSPESVIPQPATGTIHLTTPVFHQTPQQEESETNPKGKKSWLRILMILIGVGILGAASWFGYNKYLSPTKDTPVKETTQPMSLMDQELAKQKAKQQNQASQQNATKQDAIESAIAKEKAIPSRIILEVGRTEEPKTRNPKNPVKLTISKPTMITRITTDHYNNGMGTPRGGIITIKDRSGIVLDSFKALGKTGKNGTPSAKWVAEPNKIFNKGTYFIWDSEPETWSKTFVGSNGFVVVEGYDDE